MISSKRYKNDCLELILMKWHCSKIIQNHDHHMGSSPYCSNVSTFTLIKSASRAWCKTIVTTSFYIRSYNSFAPSPLHTILYWASCTANIHQDSQFACPHLPGRTWSGRTRGPPAYTTQYSGGRRVPRPWECGLSENMEGDIAHGADEREDHLLTPHNTAVVGGYPGLRNMGCLKSWRGI